MNFITYVWLWVCNSIDIVIEYLIRYNSYTVILPECNQTKSVITHFSAKYIVI